MYIGVYNILSQNMWKYSRMDLKLLDLFYIYCT